MIRNTFVPNEGRLDAKIYLIGESPGETEEIEKRPFVGQSGQQLMECLSRSGISREEVYLANLSNYRPNSNKFEELIGSKQLEDGVTNIQNAILNNRPNVVVPLGAQALKILTGKHSIHAWRGSIIQGFGGVKHIPTFHPSAVLRDRLLLPTFDFDIQRIAGDSKFPELRLPERKFVIDPRGVELEEWVQFLENSDEISVDIESTRKGLRGTKYILCIGFSPSPDLAICIVNHNDNATSNAYSRILASKAKKVFQFGTFDSIALELLNGYDINNYSWDILTGQHILNAELPRGLDYLTSIYTREPYYKDSGRAEIPGDTKEWGSKVDRQSLYVYNCRDACVTLEIKQVQVDELVGRDREMFDYEMSLIPVALDLARNGIPVDMERRELFRKALLLRWGKLQAMLDALVGRPANVRSPVIKDILYKDLGLPIKKKRDGSITTDEDAIVELITFVVGELGKLKTEKGKTPWNIKLMVLKCILEIRGIRQMISMYINAEVSEDNVLRSVYKYSNTDTGRGACEKFIDGTGVNAQTFPRGTVDVPENMDEIPMLDLSVGEEDVEVVE